MTCSFRGEGEVCIKKRAPQTIWTKIWFIDFLRTRVLNERHTCFARWWWWWRWLLRDTCFAWWWTQLRLPPFPWPVTAALLKTSDDSLMCWPEKEEENAANGEDKEKSAATERIRQAWSIASLAHLQSASFSSSIYPQQLLSKKSSRRIFRYHCHLFSHG